jgi:hypothetical protein
VLLVCAATKTEHDACAAGIRDAGARNLEPLLVGVGPARAARRLRERLNDGPTPTRVVSTGFAGALSGGVPLGGWICAHALFEWKDGTLTSIANVSPLLAAGSAFACLPCDLLSADQLLGRDSQFRELGSGRPLVADMESAGLAREAAARSVAFSVVRLVSDTPEHPLPKFLEPFTAAMTRSDAWSRASFAARGVASSLADPFGLARLLSTGHRLTKQLRADFAQLAEWLDPLG